MNAFGLPAWAIPYPGESRASWLAATRALQPISEGQWNGMWIAAADEPERPARGQEWLGLPDGLGEIESIPVCWRMASHYRDVFCDDCSVLQAGTVRWPTCIAWLDARRIVCQRHNRLLVYRSVPSRRHIDAEELLPELSELSGWLQQWQTLNQHSLEALWRRDLTHMCMRNWNHLLDHGCATSIGWELIEAGCALPGDMLMSPSMGPARLGSLPPTARLSSLLLAYRCMRYLDGNANLSVQLVPELAWQWLRRRWQRRHPQRLRRIDAHLKQMQNQSVRRRRRGLQRER